MEIKFASLKEIKEFILMVDIYQLCDKQESWTWHGYIIKDRYYDPELGREADIIVSDPKESRVAHHGHLYYISTPYYKQISWLYTVLDSFAEYNYNYNIQGKEFDKTILRGHFYACCGKYFKKYPDHTAKELMIYIIDSLQQIADLYNNKIQK